MNQPTVVVSESDQDQRRKPDMAARWRKLLEDQRVSGLPVSVFCRERGIPQSSLYAWRRRLSGGGGIFKPVNIVSESAVESVVASVVASEPHRVAVDDAAVDDAMDAGSLELRLRGGRRLLVRRGFDRRLLLDLLNVLEGDPSALEIQR